MRFNFRGKNYIIQPSKHGWLYACSGNSLHIVRVIAGQFIEFLDGSLNPIGLVSVATQQEVKS